MQRKMEKISHYKRDGDKVIERVDRTNPLGKWSIKGRDSTEMTVIDEEKPLYAQRKDICELLKYQGKKK